MPGALDSDCHLCWLAKRHADQGSKMDLCLAMAFNLGRLHVGGLIVTMCDAHRELIERQLGNVHDAIEEDAASAPPKKDFDA